MKRKGMLVLVIAMLLIGSGLMTGCQESNDPKDFKVGFIYVGPIGDGGYTYAHDQGRLYAEKELGITTVYVENVPETSECATQIENLVKQGCDMVFATSFGHMPYIKEVATKYPNVIFEHCSGYEMAENLGNYFGRMYQARYLSGIVAGKATKNGQIGYVAAMAIPEVIRGINAFTLGAQSVNPDVTVQVVWTNSWYDPTGEKIAAESLLAAGCDVISQHIDTAEPVAAAEAHGAFAVGYDSPMGDSAPNGYLTAPLWNWGTYYAKTIKAAMDGTWKAESYWGGMEDEIVMLDAFGPSVTDETKALVEEAKAKIIDGSLIVFAGPIYDQNGDLKVAEGASLTDAEMLSMEWFVKGVISPSE
ncbi:MAG: BMP family ABC transporter substrate-binding protein [Christensenellales bacterium]|jgi:basic membrane protein A